MRLETWDFMMKPQVNSVGIAISKEGKNHYILSGAMIPRTVLMAQEVAAQFTVSQLEDYGNIILNGYLDVVPNTINKKRWQYKETTTAPIDLPSLTQVQPALKGWTTNYMEYYTQLQPNGYGVNPGDPTMFEYDVHSFTLGAAPISSIYGLQPGSGYNVGVHTNVPAVGGHGTGATLDISVGAGGVVVSATLNNPGTGYVPGDGLTVTSLGAGYGFAVFVGPIAAPITALGVPAPGSGYTPGTYVGVATTTSGTGTGATLDVVVNASGQVTSATLNAAGTGYKVGDTLTSAAVGPGTGFTITVTSVVVANPAGQSQWAQPPHRLINATVADFVPPGPNQQAIQYSAILYPVADNPTPPPVDVL